jgi:hypothetical protein
LGELREISDFACKIITGGNQIDWLGS